MDSLASEQEYRASVARVVRGVIIVAVVYLAALIVPKLPLISDMTFEMGPRRLPVSAGLPVELALRLACSGVILYLVRPVGRTTVVLAKAFLRRRAAKGGPALEEVATRATWRVAALLALVVCYFVVDDTARLVAGLLGSSSAYRALLFLVVGAGLWLAVGIFRAMQPLTEQLAQHAANAAASVASGTVYRNCPKCGTGNDSSSAFCSKCGASLASQ